MRYLTTMKKINLIAFAIVALLAGCQGETENVDRPLYPTEGAINARYTIADGVTVVFAKGNLQYQASSHSWRFANRQYDVIGYNNGLADTTYSGWIDLFGWGTSGEGDLMPYTLSDTSDRYAYGMFDIGGTQYDWGLHNPISNGGNRVGEWRTMTLKEWTYLMKYRTSAQMKKAFATIENVGVDGADMHGLMFLPDKWELPEGCTFQYGVKEGFSTNVYSADQWNKMEGAGAIFLPAAGERDGVTVSLVGDYGCYWTTSGYTLESAYELYFLSSGYDFYPTNRATGHSIRLVMEK